MNSNDKQAGKNNYDPYHSVAKIDALIHIKEGEYYYKSSFV